MATSKGSEKKAWMNNKEIQIMALGILTKKSAICLKKVTETIIFSLNVEDRHTDGHLIHKIYSKKITVFIIIPCLLRNIFPIHFTKFLFPRI